MIVGAGLAGLIVAHAFPREQVVEASAEPRTAHKALLRFRSSAVSDLTGIPFRKVVVRKGIWSDDRFVEPDIRVANLYAKKCLGRLAGDRSIWNLAPVERFIAPEDFHAMLLDNIGARIKWGHQADFSSAGAGPIISTAPMPVVLDALGWTSPFELQRAPISVARYRVAGADLHQTIYFPDSNTKLYRASMTGDVLICEFAGELAVESAGEWMRWVRCAFGLGGAELVELDKVSQRYGKIAAVEDGPRKVLIHRLSVEAGIFSIGRFATWRNILLDDVVKDIGVVKRLIHASTYDRRMAAL